MVRDLLLRQWNPVIGYNAALCRMSCTRQWKGSISITAQPVKRVESLVANPAANQEARRERVNRCLKSLGANGTEVKERAKVIPVKVIGTRVKARTEKGRRGGIDYLDGHL